MSSRHHCCNVVETIFIDSEWNVFVIGLFPFTERVIFAMIKTYDPYVQLQYRTRNQAVARLADHTASQQTITVSD